MSFSIKYNASQEEIENLSKTTNFDNMSEATTSVEDSPKSKKVDKSGSILEKYFKSFKVDKNTEEDPKSSTEVSKDNTERKSLDVSNESSGSPIKEYLNKLSKRSDSIDTNSDVDSVKENKDRDLSINSDKWKIFNDFKYKIAQAVEDIKSSRSSEVVESKEKIGNIDNCSVTDSEENSLQQELEPNSCLSTENQVSSLTNSTQNLSELSPPIISHSSTMTDMDMDLSNSSDTNQNVTETIEHKREHEKIAALNAKSIQYVHSDDSNDEHIEVESGVDALEDEELVMPKETPSCDDLKIVYEKPMVVCQSPPPLSADNNKSKRSLFNKQMVFFTSLIIISFILLPTMLLFNGFLFGIWFSHFIYECYLVFLDKLGGEDVSKKSLIFPTHQNLSLANVPQIVEFEPLKKYHGWINVYLVGVYDPLEYHISMTQTAFMKLEGSSLRLSFTHNKIPKRAMWDEKTHKVPFYQHRIYNLEGAKIKLLPTGIVKKRHWSKKYPICIILKDASKLTIYNAKSDSLDVNEQTDSDKLSKSDHSKSEPKNIQNENDNKHKDSPKRIIAATQEKLSRSLPIDIASSNSGDRINKKIHDDFMIGKSPLAKVDTEIKKMKKTDSSDNQNNENDFNDFPILKDRPESSNSMYSDDQMNEPGFLDDFKEVSQFLNTDNSLILEYDKNIASDEWSKDENFDVEEDLVILYLFGRTGREKDEWYRRLKTAIKDAAICQESNLDESSTVSAKEEDQNDVTKNLEPFDSLYDDLKNISSQKDYIESKVKLGNTKSPKKSSSETQSVLWTAGDSVKDSPLISTFSPNRGEDFWRYMKDIIDTKKTNNDEDQPANNVIWLNAIIGRVIFDMFKNDAWVTMIQERIQKKLQSLKLPPFMSPLNITALKFGSKTPQIHSASFPKLDARGVWVDLQLSYEGCVTMTLATQLNLMYLKEKKDNQSTESVLPRKISKSNSKDVSLAVYDSDLDDTAESSSEDDTPLVQPSISKSTVEADPAALAASGTSSSAKKILRFVDKIAASKYFQHVTEYKYVKRALEEVSNTDLKLSVELYGLVGCLTINIPPPPSDRIWIGFRDNPQILLKAKPEVGSRAINFAHVTSWIEKKLCAEFEKVLVLPNMEDFQFDFMIAPNID